MEVYFSLFCEFFKKNKHFFPVNPKKRRYGRADPDQIQSKRCDKARRLPNAEPSVTKQHTDHKQLGCTDKTEKEITEDSGRPPGRKTDLPQQIIKQTGCQPAERCGGNGYRLCTD